MQTHTHTHKHWNSEPTLMHMAVQIREGRVTVRSVLFDVSLSLGSVWRFFQHHTGGYCGLFIQRGFRVFLSFTSHQLFLQNIELKWSFTSFIFFALYFWCQLRFSPLHCISANQHSSPALLQEVLLLLLSWGVSNCRFQRCFSLNDFPLLNGDYAGILTLKCTKRIEVSCG